jgi:hypothetical protein
MMTERGFQNKYNVPPSTEALRVVFKGYRVVWQLQWTARRQIRKAHNSRAGKGVVLNAEQKDGGLVCRYGCRTVEIWRVVPEGIQLFADTIQLVKSSAAEPASTVLETAAL